jgi:serine/threonine protein kinase
MDFGIARLADAQSKLTEVGMIIGTPAYMAPEQMLGETVDERTDLYAAGVVLYECLTGRLPYQADSPIMLVAKQLREDPPPPSAFNPDVTPALSALILRLLGKQPGDRPASAAELATLLGKVH